jgi:hypothetical protein
MPVQSVRSFSRDPQEPVVHELDPLRLDGREVPVRVIIRRAEDGLWRGRMAFGDAEDATRETAEIFCGGSEQELWESIGHLREHHLRDLFRSLGT